MDSSYRRLHELFEACRRLPGEERELFLASRCAPGSPLRERLDELLASAVESEDALFSDDQLQRIRKEAEGLRPAWIAARGRPGMWLQSRLDGDDGR